MAVKRRWIRQISSAGAAAGVLFVIFAVWLWNWQPTVPQADPELREPTKALLSQVIRDTPISRTYPDLSRFGVRLVHPSGPPQLSLASLISNIYRNMGGRWYSGPVQMYYAKVLGGPANGHTVWVLEDHMYFPHSVPLPPPTSVWNWRAWAAKIQSFSDSRNHTNRELTATTFIFYDASTGKYSGAIRTESAVPEQNPSLSKPNIASISVQGWGAGAAGDFAIYALEPYASSVVDQLTRELPYDEIIQPHPTLSSMGGGEWLTLHMRDGSSIEYSDFPNEPSPPEFIVTRMDSAGNQQSTSMIRDTSGVIEKSIREIDGTSWGTNVESYDTFLKQLTMSQVIAIADVSYDKSGLIQTVKPLDSRTKPIVANIVRALSSDATVPSQKVASTRWNIGSEDRYSFQALALYLKDGSIVYLAGQTGWKGDTGNFTEDERLVWAIHSTKSGESQALLDDPNDIVYSLRMKI